MLVHPIERIGKHHGEAAAAVPAGATVRDLPVLPCFRLAGGVTLVALEAQAWPGGCLPEGVALEDLKVTAAGMARSGPASRVRLPRRDGGERVVAVMAIDPDAAVFCCDGKGRHLARVAPRGERPADPGLLAAGLDAVGCQRLIRQALDAWPRLFRLGKDAGYARFCRRLLRLLVPDMCAAMPEAVVNRQFVLAGMPLDSRIGDVADVVVVGANGVVRAPCRPLQLRKGPAFLLLQRDAIDAESLIVVFGAAGHAVFQLPAMPQKPLLDWLGARRQLAAQMRAFLARAFADMPDEDGSGAALRRELDLFSPPAVRNLLARNTPVNAAVELLVADGAGGIFIRGWLRDPHQLVAGAELQAGGSAPLPLDPVWLRFPRPDIDKLYKARPAAFGFVAHLGQLLEPAGEAILRLHLSSGGIIELAARFAAGHPAELRDAVLGGVPPEQLTTDAIARIVAPAAVPLHRQHLARRQAPEIVQFGEPVAAPRFSLIVPLYRNLDYLRFQLGAFATDPAMRRAELIFVLDSPEQRADLVHFLSGLHQLYGLPMTIAVMSGNFGYAAANNAGAALARGDVLVLLNSDVVPEAPGWMQRQAAPLRRKNVVATGARLLFDDQSLQHAGMRFARDAGGHWLNLHYHKGAPRDFAPALKARKVPAVTGAALMVRREAFLAVGGFTEDYIIGDYEDSDLCLKLRQAGGEICYCPDAVLYHFERKSINRHAGYQRSVAGLYNRWLAAQRWDGAMADLMTRFERRGKRPAA